MQDTLENVKLLLVRGLTDVRLVWESQLAFACSL